MIKVVSVTKKGQATIPKGIREKHGIKDKVVIIDGKGGILLKPLPRPDEDLGSLRDLFRGKGAKTLLSEAREEEYEKEKKPIKNAKT